MLVILAYWEMEIKRIKANGSQDPLLEFAGAKP
jgi:hypothetical protein